VTTKSGEKNARKQFSKNTRIGYPKIFGKKSSGKSVKIRSLYKHEYRDVKSGEKTREKFKKKQRIGYPKKF